mmetsp:Transcript_14677/g.47979  ORF Transcript_14677/g.47979 Transcript_14677/m.47979 type:complete len:475 (-) Transcript_14677:343-1767(-)
MAEPSAAEPSAAEPSVSTKEYNATPDAIDGLADALADPEITAETDVDVPEPVGLQEQETDTVLDKTPSTDALYGVICQSFDDEKLGLPPLLLKGLQEMKFVRPSKIQAASLPKIWAGRELLAQSHNGTGKTACFVLGMLKAATPEPEPQALCLCPTRELAKQIGEEILKMGKFMLQESGIRLKVILREERYTSGEKLEDQLVVGTPGKVWTLINMKVLQTDRLKIFVLDEADEMLMLGGLGDTTKRIRQRLPKSVQTLFFSATWTDPVKKFAKQMSAVSGREWSQIEVQRSFIFNDQVRQMFYRTSGAKEKEARLAEILNVVTVGQCIIFVHTRDAVDRLAAMLEQNGHTVSSLHGRMEEKARDKVLNDFRAGTTRFLITTNVLARGVDVPAVTLVIQYDMPAKKGGGADPETYLHRVGRTGRFGRPGCALNLIGDANELKLMKAIEVYFSRENLITEIPQDTDPEEFERLLKA